MRRITLKSGTVVVLPDGSPMNVTGEYNSETQYGIDDIVLYNGSSYIAIVATIGNDPTNAQYWRMIASKGDQGEKGDTGDTGAKGDQGDQGAQGLTGADGDSAYEIAVAQGFVGTIEQWIASLKGDKGDQGEAGTAGASGADGDDGRSAYQVAVDNGFVGTEIEWLASLQGADGQDGTNGTNGVDGDDGASAYEVAVANGFVGSESEWLLSLKGAKGDTGDMGATGATGATGANGDDGLSAYEVAVANGFVGTEAEWLESLQGTDGVNGSDGADGQGVPTGGSTGQVLKKNSASDFDTVWANESGGGGSLNMPHYLSRHSQPFVAGDHVGTVLTTYNLNSYQIFHPVVFTEDVTVRSLHVHITGVASGKLVSFGIYSNQRNASDDDVPYQLLTSINNIDTSVVGRVGGQLSEDYVLTAGTIYWFSITTNATALTLYALNTTSIMPRLGRYATASGASVTFLFITNNTATLSTSPAVASGSFSNSPFPAIYITRP